MDLRSAIQHIKSHFSLTDLARRYVELRPQGARMTGPCPFHQETKPSFFVNEEKGSFYCFGCQASGDLIEFYCRINGLEFYEGITQLAEEAGITIDRSQREKTPAPSIRKDAKAMHLDAAHFFSGMLAGSSGRECREYLQKRGISQEIIDKFDLGWAERSWNSLQRYFIQRSHDPAVAVEAGLLGKSAQGTFYDRFRGRLMFPIKDLSNQVIAFGGRIIADEEEAKYINSADTPIYNKRDNLYGLAQARRGIVTKGHALLTEGYMDVLTLHQFGFDNSVGVLGTALTEGQIHRLCGFTSHITLVFDGDRAGRAAALRSAELLLMRGISCKVISLPQGEDIDSYLRGFGQAAFASLCEDAPDGLSYCLNEVKTFSPRDGINWARNFLAKIRLPELASPYASAIAHRLGLAEDQLRSNLSASAQPRGDSLPVSKLCERDTQIILFAVRYPERLEDLRQIGADLALANPRSRAFWDIIAEHGADAVYYLDERQKAFWQQQRGPDAPPCNNGDLELRYLRENLDRFYAQSQLASLAAAISGSPGHDSEMDLQYLQALQNTMRKDNE